MAGELGERQRLFDTYAEEWHFSPITITVIFSAYAIAVLVALLILGRVSDHTGRRPVLLVQYAPAPTHVVYLVLVGVFVLQGIGEALSPKTSARKPGLRAAWALSGFYGSLGPALARQLSGSASAVIGGMPFFLLAVIGSLTAVALTRIPPRTVLLCGIAATMAAAAGTLAAVEKSSTAGFLASIVVAGVGLGAGLQGAFRTVVPLAPPGERAGVPSVRYVVSYCGMGVPAITAGILVVHGGGLIGSARDYALFLIVLAAGALARLLSTNRSERRPTGSDPAASCLGREPRRGRRAV